MTIDRFDNSQPRLLREPSNLFILRTRRGERLARSAERRALTLKIGVVPYHSLMDNHASVVAVAAAVTVKKPELCA